MHDVGCTHVCSQLKMVQLMVQRLPERILEKAVKGMLPSGRLGRHLFTHLKVLPSLAAKVLYQS